MNTWALIVAIYFTPTGAVDGPKTLATYSSRAECEDIGRAFEATYTQHYVKVRWSCVAQGGRPPVWR
jgi:hypothetical protein